MKHSVEIREADFPGAHWIVPDDDDERATAEHSEVDAARAALEVVEGWLDELLPVVVTRRIPSSTGETWVMVERFGSFLDAEEFVATLPEGEQSDFNIDGPV